MQLGVGSETDEKILKAAQDHFAKKGFHDTRVSEIADDAGVGKGTVYRHFGKKTVLFAGLIEQVSHQLTERIREIPAETSDPVRQVERIFEIHMETFCGTRPLMTIFVNEGLRKTGEYKEPIIRQWRSYRELVEKSFKKGIEANRFVDRDPMVLTRLFLSWIWGLFRSAVIFDETELAESDGDVLIETFLEGITTENEVD